MYYGLEFENIPPLLANLATRPDGSIDASLWEAMNTTMSLDRVLEIAEMDLVARSWHRAREANLKAQ